MNHRVTPPASAKGRRLWLYLALLLPSLAGEVAQHPAASDRREGYSPRHWRSTPYLLVVGSPELRFQEEPPSPDLSAPPTASLPPKVEKAESTSQHSDVVVSNRPLPTASAATAPVTTEPTDSSQAQSSRPPPPTILPDDVNPKVRPEDFLPFFQFPGSGPNDANLARVPRPNPPSSATYQEQ
jgi:hypothetical protein